MGKASSAKKVARAARAGGKKTSGNRRQLGFPIAIGVIIVLGLTLVAFARSENSASASDAPPTLDDHWHAAYGIYVCDRFLANVGDKGSDKLGIHTHEDGLVHIHPFLPGAAGDNAKFSVWFDQVGMKVTDTALRLPEAQPFDGRLYKEGSTTCGGEPATVKVVHWADAVAASQGAEPTDVITEDFGSIRFAEDLGAYTIAFVPEGTDVPPPPGSATIVEKGAADGGTGPPTDGQPQISIPTDTGSVPASGDTSAPGSTAAP